MKYPPQNNKNATANLQGYIAKNNLASKVDLEKTGTIKTFPLDGATGVNIAGPLEWEQYDSFLRYRLIVTRDSDSAEVVNTTVVGTSYDTDLDASTLYSWKVYAITPKPQSSPDPTPNVTGITFSPSSPTLDIDDTVEISASVEGTDLTDTTVTWSKVSGDADLTIQSFTDNTVTIVSSATATDADSAVFRATADQDGTTTADVTVTVDEVTTSLDDSAEGDLQALKDIYDQTDGDNWDNSWDRDNLTTANMGDAFGIEVWEGGDDAGRVKVVHLFDNGLTNIQRDGAGDKDLDSRGRYQLIDGKNLKETIGNLKKAEYIDLRMNELTGTIPDSFWLLSNLKWAGLGFCDQERFSNSNYLPDEGSLYSAKRPYEEEQGQSNNGAQYYGSIPSTVSNMTSLRTLLLERNYFDQTSIPTELFELPELRRVEIGSNGHTGSLPNVTLPANIYSIGTKGGAFDRSTASVNERSGTGPHYYLSGSLPSSWGTSTSLFQLYIHFNEFTGAIPTEWGGMEGIRKFSIANTPGIDGDFPSFWTKGNAPILNTFIMSRTGVEGEIDPDFKLGNQIAVFNLLNCNVGGNLPTSMTDSTHEDFPNTLRILYLGNNSFTGSIMDDLSGLFQIRNFRLDNNNFTGDLPLDYPPSELANTFFLSNNSLTGTIRSTLGNMTGPREIAFNNNNISSYEEGAISPVVLSGGDYVSGMFRLFLFSVSFNDLTQSDLDQIILDMWANVQSRQGTEFDNWAGVNTLLNLQGQSTGASPSNTTEINDAISGLEAEGWTVNRD